MSESLPHAENRTPHWLGEIAGAFGDLGTFLPLVIGVLLLGSFDAVGVLIGFGVFAVATGIIYRRPVPVQPMKAITAYIIVGGLSAGAVAASGLLLGIVLLVLGATGLFKQLDRWVPRSVLSGIQLGLGLSLVWVATDVAAKDLLWACALLVTLYALRLTRFGVLGAPLLLLGGLVWSWWHLDAVVSMPELQWHWPVFTLPSLSDMGVALKTAVIPQFAMTLTNAILLTAVVAAEYFPDDVDRNRIKPRNLAVSTGLFNLLLAPFGALPMCHGAGGLAAHYHQGALTGWAPVIFGVCCLLLGIIAGSQAVLLLTLVPVAVMAALLAFAGLQLSNPLKIWQSEPLDQWVALVVAAVCLFVNVGVSLVVGVLICAIIRRWK